MNTKAKTGGATSPIFDMVGEELRELARIKDVSVSMREFEQLRISAPKEYTAKKVAQVRKNLQVSQSIFAYLLNVKATTVQKWERGVNQPHGSSSRLLELLEKNGAGILGELSSR